MIGQEPKRKGHRLLTYYWQGVETISPDTLCLTSYLTIKLKISSRATISFPSTIIIYCRSLLALLARDRLVFRRLLLLRSRCRTRSCTVLNARDTDVIALGRRSLRHG